MRIEFFVIFHISGRETATQSYILIYNWKTWSEARRYCRDHHTDLANVRNQTENQRILEITQVYGYGYGYGVWIGLYRNRIWSNRQNTPYQNWRPQIPGLRAQPDNGVNIASAYGYQHCTAVSFRYSGRWTDEICLSSMPFFCYSSKFTCFVRCHYLAFLQHERFNMDKYTTYLICFMSIHCNCYAIVTEQ